MSSKQVFGKLKIGMSCWSDKPWKTVQIASDAGFNCVVIDFEHGGCSISEIEPAAALARALDIILLVRVRSASDIGVVLDCGANGVLLPHVESSEHAVKLAILAKYPKDGKRSLSSTRLQQFSSGINIEEAIVSANRNTFVLAMVESASAVRQINEIVSVPQIDGVVVGSLDLSADLGCPEKYEDPRIHEAHHIVAQVCQRYNKIFGVFWRDSTSIKDMVSLKPDLIITKSDESYFIAAATKEIINIKNKFVSRIE
ncbi:aldolase/citrate lyase family protein [Acinetobacter baumannii]|nr:aldolase/citrate lyase family protein [Acinetobacter baumannii]MDC5547696.1 aldolase/citrate lyase family protein [Acinetobacter baumannii]MDX7929019.1 aldolase/citrate lyase family protein [Acinetobacter baumannii]